MVVMPDRKMTTRGFHFEYAIRWLLVWLGLVWSGLVWSGLVWSGLPVRLSVCLSLCLLSSVCMCVSYMFTDLKPRCQWTLVSIPMFYHKKFKAEAMLKTR